MSRIETSTSGEDFASLQVAPGTELLFDELKSHNTTAEHIHGLQHKTSGDSRILLVPQPSLTDPNDPLRWTTAKKWLVLWNACWYAFLGSITGPIMAAGMLPLATQFDTTLQRLTYANGATLICQGLFNFLWMPFAVKYGRRPVYLASNFLMMIACIWLGVASTKTYTIFIVGRAFLGAWEAPIESIVPSTVTDLFFLHDRGEKISLYGLAILGGNELGPMFSAIIIQALGMNWAFFIVAMFIGASFISTFFFMPETKYTGYRPSIFPSSTVQETSAKEAATSVEATDSNLDPPTTLPKKTYLQELKPWTTSDPNVNLLKTFVRPFILYTYPTVLWACFVYGLALSYNVILGATVAQLFSVAPYNFDSQAQGLTFLSPFVGSLVGTYLCGPCADAIANYYTKKNNGIREPEMRLPTCAVAAFFTFFGTLWAALAYDHKTHWAVVVVGYGVLSIGTQMGATLSMSYALDCHKELSVELMVSVASLKSLIAWIWTWEINDFITADGMLTAFMTLATIATVIYLTTFAMYFKGKSVRIWIAKKNFLKFV
ncbi:putative cycloheximide resistance [Phaeomoniella chlamydospora]|uniref:Putative cycloheximide resistance n=1 Tax=Phaeomoniella chlamydospora TaxID=158046 RepID=A0A0G2GHU2_PHACM|nr:putative cycloheximide resistance [Phaeomoniella chlamydospora]